MKKWIITALVISFVSLALGAPAEAGDRSRHRWQGIAIGAASTILLQHVFHVPAGPVQAGYYAPSSRPDYGYGPGAYCPPRPYRRGHDRRYSPRAGHWETVWIPGHYDSVGKYVDGHYERYHVSGRWYD